MREMPKIPEFVISRKVRIRKGLHVLFMMGSTGQIHVEWDLYIPTNLTSKQIRRYREAHGEVLTEWCERTDSKVLLIEA